MTPEQTALKRVTRFAAGGTPSVGEPQFWSDDTGTPWVAIGDMTSQPLVRRTERRVTVEGIASKRLPVGQKGMVLFAMYASVGTVSVLDTEASWNQAILGMEPIPSLSDQRFLVYWLLSLRPRLQEHFRSNTQDNLNAEQVGNLPYPVLPVERQRAIADFLDTETARIDALIEKKRRMIELLEDQYWSWVSERIRRVPAPTVQLRRALVWITDGPFGSSLTSSHYSDAGARVVRLGNIGMVEFKNEDEAYIPTEHYATLLKHSVQAGDLLIAGLGDANNHVGRGCVAPDLGRAIVKADCYCAKVDAHTANPQFLALYLSSPLGRNAVANLSRGSTRTRINLDVAKSVPIILPSPSEQTSIVNEAGRRRRVTLSAQHSLDTQIELLTEHRQALITAAATG